MTQLLSKKLPIISITKSDGFNVVYVTEGKFINDYFLLGKFCRVGMSDGTLIVFDDNKTPSLNVLHKGSAFVSFVEKDNAVIFDDKKVNWILYEE